MKKKLPFILSTILVSFQITLAQTNNTFQYFYDDAGNRYQRTFTLSPRLSNPADSIKQVLSDKIADYKVKIAPNPTKGGVSVQIIGDDKTEQSKIEVYDVSGKLIFYKAALTEFTSIDLTKQLSGNYFLKIFVEGEMREWKIVKTN